MKNLTPMIKTMSTAIAAVPEKKADPFYLSPEWRRLLAEIKRERGDRCEDPQHDPGIPRTGVRIDGDHIKEIKDGGSPLDKRNVMLRCHPCHSRKTVEARRIRFASL